jgi:hypothetical protein
MLRRREQRRFSSASDDEVGGTHARDARAAPTKGQQAALRDLAASVGIARAARNFASQARERHRDIVLTTLAFCPIDQRDRQYEGIGVGRT